MSGIELVATVINSMSGVAVAIAAAFGLRQLTISRELARISAKRESFQVAADQCSAYLNGVIPKLERLDVVLGEQGIALETLRPTIETTRITLQLPKDRALMVQLASIAPSITDALNALEAFAVFFASGVADESVAFRSVGSTYVSNVRKLLPLIIMVSGGKYYTSILRVFSLWNARLERQNLLTTKEQIEAKLGTISEVSIRPIGT